MAVIARCNGVVLVDDGGRLGVVEQGAGWVGTALFVTALVAGALAVNGALQLGFNVVLGVALLAGAAVVLAGAVGLARWRRRLRARPDAGAPHLVFDLPAGVLRDGGGAALGALAEVYLTRVWQAGSSSKALAVHFPGGRRVIARGTPFGDSVDAVEHALAARGVRAAS